MALRKEKIIATSLLLIFSIIMWFIPYEKIPKIDDMGNKYFRVALKKAAVTYVIVRSVNAIVSVLKSWNFGGEFKTFFISGSSNITVGEILDPIDDITERLSTLLTISIATLGTLKIIYELTVQISPKILSFLLLISAILMWLPKSHYIKALTLNTIIVIIVARLGLPMCGIINETLQKQFFEPKIKKYEKTLSGLPDFSNALTNTSTIKEIANKTKYILNIIKEVLMLKKEIINALIGLITLYTAILVIQIFLIPITFAYIGIKLINSLYETKIKEIFVLRKAA